MVLGCPTPGGSVGTLSSYKFHLGCHPAVEGVSPHAEMGQQFLGGAELINARASVLLPLLSSLWIKMQGAPGTIICGQVPSKLAGLACAWAPLGRFPVGLVSSDP